ncbi:MAG: hypothetical protein FJX77_17795, partial [Armatimonadetes bacterium]|nr:hypothetical protein [Armatimonadota bacterium]
MTNPDRVDDSVLALEELASWSVCIQGALPPAGVRGEHDLLLLDPVGSSRFSWLRTLLTPDPCPTQPRCRTVILVRGVSSVLPYQVHRSARQEIHRIAWPGHRFLLEALLLR